MTVKELIDRLEQCNQDAIVYYDEAGIALMVLDVTENATVGEEDTVLIS